jgi:hypothetical protein
VRKERAKQQAVCQGANEGDSSASEPRIVEFGTIPY